MDGSRILSGTDLIQNLLHGSKAIERVLFEIVSSFHLKVLELASPRYLIHTTSSCNRAIIFRSLLLIHVIKASQNHVVWSKNTLAVRSLRQILLEV